LDFFLVAHDDQHQPVADDPQDEDNPVDGGNEDPIEVVAELPVAALLDIE